MTAASPRIRQFADCAYCGQTFEIRAPGQRFDSDACRDAAKHAKTSTSPQYRLSVRQRCRAWAAERRGCKTPQPWLYGPPVFESHLPGGGLEMFADTPLKWPLEHRNVRGLHGAITALTGDHDQLLPRFSLIPWNRGIGWSVYMDDLATARELAGTRHESRIYEQTITLRFGGLVRIKAPMIEQRGRRRLRVDCVTPVCTRETGGVAHQRASGPNLLNTLCAWLPRRLGIDLGPDDARLEIVQNDTHAAHLPLGGKFGTVSGWDGSLVVDCNAVAEWLLRAGETIGIGGRVAFGMGRVCVSKE